MFMSPAVNATSGPVAPVEFLPSRAVAPVSGHAGVDARHEVKASSASEPVRDSGAAGRAIAQDTGDKTGKAASANSAAHTASAANTLNSAFNYDSATRHVVMQLRDGSGAVVIQIPSEQALRQYEQTLKRSQENAAATQDVAPAAESARPQAAAAALSSGSATIGAGARYNTVV